MDEPPIPPPGSEAGFQHYMEAMDRRFQLHRVGIPGRQLAAIAEVMRSYGLEEIAVPNGEPDLGAFEPRDVLLRAFA